MLFSCLYCNIWQW